jgi:pyrimidine and pyridine-specific 5'-nucleotidase
VIDPSKCLFVDDNRRNIDTAVSLGWGRCVHFAEDGLQHVEGGRAQTIDGSSRDNVIPVINDLEELRTVWKDIF